MATAPILIHFGDNCGPGIIINDILGQRRKNLFQMGVYRFNSILMYLRDNKFDSIYDKTLLVNAASQPLTGFRSVHAKYGHLGPARVKHHLYDFIFNHDYIVEANTVMNYDFIVASYREKIRNFQADLNNPAPKILINFTPRLSGLHLIPMIQQLRQTIPSKKFVLVMFTWESEPNPSHLSESELELIRLDQPVLTWWQQSAKQREPLYRQIYTKFHAAMTRRGLSLPPYDQTPYFRSIH